MAEKEKVGVTAPGVRTPGPGRLQKKKAINLGERTAGGGRPPLAPLPEEDRQELRVVLADLGLLKGEAARK